MVMIAIQLHAYVGFFVFFSGVYLITTFGRTKSHRRVGQIHVAAVLIMAVSGIGSVFLPGFSDALANSTAVTAFGRQATEGDAALLALVFISFVAVHFSASGARIWVRLRHSTDRIRAFPLDYMITLLMCIAVAAGGRFVVSMVAIGEYREAIEGLITLVVPLLSIAFDIYSFVARPKCTAINWRLVHASKMMWTVSVCFSALWLRLQDHLPELFYTRWPTFWFFGVAMLAVLTSELLRRRRLEHSLVNK